LFFVLADQAIARLDGTLVNSIVSPTLALFGAETDQTGSGTSAPFPPIFVYDSAHPMGVAYIHLWEAFMDIDLGGYSGDITIYVYQDIDEGTTSAVLNASGTGTASYNSITIKPDGGGPRTISGTTDGSPLIDIDGGDNVTFDGLDTDSNSLTIINYSTSNLAGTSTLRFRDGATTCKIKNMSIFGSSTTPMGTAGGNIVLGTDAMTANGNDNNMFINNRFGPAGVNLPTKLAFCGGSTTTSAIANSGNMFSGNNFYDFFSANSSSAAFVGTAGCSNYTLTSNKIYQTGNRTYAGAGQNYGFFVSANGATSGAQGVSFTNNTIGYASPDQTGTYTLTGGSGKFVGIFFAGIAGGTLNNISNNVLAHISLTTSANGFGAANTLFGMIAVLSGPVNMSGDTISHVACATNSATQSEAYGMVNSGLDPWTVSQATIDNLNFTNAGSGTSVNYGIRSQISAASAFSATSNLIDSNSLNAVNTFSQIVGIAITNGTGTVTGNTVRNQTTNIGSGTGNGTSNLGINSSSASNQVISGNRVYGLSNTNPSGPSVVTGIQLNNGGAANVIAKNLVYGLISSSSDSAAEIDGIRTAAGTTTIKNNMVALGAGISNALGSAATDTSTSGINAFLNAGGTNNLYFNSGYVGGSSTTGSGASYVFNQVVNSVSNSIRNNIWYNARTDTGTATGRNYAVKLRSGGQFPDLDLQLYEILAPNGYLVSFGGVDYTHLPEFHAATNAEANGLETDPEVVDPTNATPDLHIGPNSPARDSGASVAGVTDDFDGDTRDSMPDRGADEYTTMVASPTSTSSVTSTATNTPTPNPSPVTPGIRVFKLNDTTNDPLPGWQINLHLGTACAGAVLGSGMTNASGYVDFPNLPTASYSVEEVLQPGWTPATGLCKDVMLNRPNGREVFGGLFLATFRNIAPPPSTPTVTATSTATPTPSVFINEVDSDTTGTTDTLEFVELFDGGIGFTHLDGLVVVFYDGATDSSYAAFDLDGFQTNAQGYFTLGNAAVSGVDLVFADGLLQNGADAVALYNISSAPPNGTPVFTTNLVDALVYDTGQPDDPGLLGLLNPGQPQVNENANLNGEGVSMQRCPNGAGGLRNTMTYQDFIPTPDHTNTCGVMPTATPTPTATCVPPPNMVSWWRGENDVSDYFNLNNGTFAAATYASGKVGQAFSFDGTTSYVSVPDNANLYPQAGSFTVAAWINTSQMTGFQQVIAHYECSNNCPQGANSVYDLFLNGDKLEGQIRDTTGADQEVIGTRNVADGQFHHVALERDVVNSQMRLYVDGTVEASAALIPTGVITNDDFDADPVTIGAIIQNNFTGCGCPIQFFNGRIDEIQYYGRALTTNEIAGIYNAGSAGQCPPSISGTVLYGNAIGAPTPRFVSNVTITAAGSPNVAATTLAPGANAGTYFLSGLSTGPYTVTPTKSGGVNGISSFDAALIALHVAGPPNPQLNPTQLMVADVSGNGAVTSFDAGMIAKFVAGPPYAPPGIGQTATWKFTPPSRSYMSVAGPITGQDFMGFLFGDVSGNWGNSGARAVNASGPVRGAAVSLQQITGRAGKEVVLPVKVDGVADRNIISYEFDLRYDPTIIQPMADPADVTGTASRALSVVTNSREPGLLRVVAYGAVPLDNNNNGVLMNLRFTLVGEAGSSSPLVWERILFNEGDPQVTSTDGGVELF
jgi:hypothetical protein